MAGAPGVGLSCGLEGAVVRAGQVASPNSVIGQGNFGTESGAVTHHQGFVKWLATVAQPRRQIVQGCLNGCLVGGSSGPGWLVQGQVAIGTRARSPPGADTGRCGPGGHR